MNVRAGRFPLFDSLRAIAAIAVVTTHAAFFSGALNSHIPLLRQIASRLDVGVTIFFFISAFLLYRPFARAALREEDSPQLLPYAWRRVLRIVPAYWLALTVTSLLLGYHYVFTVKGAIVHYGFLQIYRTSTLDSGLGQAWTLCIEVTFYAFLPLWAWSLAKVRWRTPKARLRGELWALAALAAASIAFKVIVLAAQPAGPMQATWSLWSLPAYLDQFAVGMAIALLSVWWEERPELPRVLRPIDRFPSIAWLFALGALLFVAAGIGVQGHFPEAFSKAQFLEMHLLYTLVGFGVILPAVFGNQERGGVRRFLANRVLLWLGLISYGIYLWHQMIFTKLVQEHVNAGAFIHPYIGWWSAAMLGGIALATVSYYAMERPLMRFRHLVPTRRKGFEGEALAEPAPLVPEPVSAAGDGA
jgi:peptidoglycan/LPS O-acetylase OafA/YrhL